MYIQKIVKSPHFIVSKKQVRYFFVAIIAFYIVKGSPLSVIASYYLFSAHTFQLSIIFFLVMPLLILSLPTEFYRQYIWNYRTQLILKIFAYPWLTLIAFNGLLSVYFIPTVFNFINDSFILTTLAQTILIFNAFFMWWVIINPIPEL